MKEVVRKYKSFLLILSSLLLFFSCEKQTLEPSEDGVPQLYFEAKYNGYQVRFDAGINNIVGNSYKTYYYDDSLIVYNFSLEHISNSSVRYMHLSVYNYTFPFKSKVNDIDSTILPGKYLYAYNTPRPNNPKHLSEVILTCYTYSGYPYSSSYFDQKYSNFEITKVVDTTVIINRVTQQVKKAEIKFYCTLKNKIWGDTLNISDGKMSVYFVKQ
ncbi:MAG: hypothetical protein GX437_03315 [Sphingobacteriales bacterium]|nr:hypothetical protein [Sphingobacteriales bacterium]